jgi:hypothetical protein
MQRIPSKFNFRIHIRAMTPRSVTTICDSDWKEDGATAPPLAPGFVCRRGEPGNAVK